MKNRYSDLNNLFNTTMILHAYYLNEEFHATRQLTKRKSIVLMSAQALAEYLNLADGHIITGIRCSEVYDLYEIAVEGPRCTVVGFDLEPLQTVPIESLQ